ncbi:MAG TPA: hypothetical protein VIU81_12670 [Gaiellaceae bacterium]
MTVTALASSVPFRRPRLIRAEVLKLRKRRGLVLTAGLLTVGAMLVTYTILVSIHAANPAHHGPAGGIQNLGHTIWLIGTLGSVVGILIGATAGAGDLGAGVFRELVVTGRSRAALFAARIPGGLTVLFAFVGIAYALTASGSVAFAGSLPAPSVKLLVESGLWVLLTTGFWFAIGLGISSIVGSRTTTIATLLPFQLAISPILANIKILGSGRAALPVIATDNLLPNAFGDTARTTSVNPTLSAAVALLVLAGWACAILAAGLWRTRTRDA